MNKMIQRFNILLPVMLVLLVGMALSACQSGNDTSTTPSATTPMPTMPATTTPMPTSTPAPTTVSPAPTAPAGIPGGSVTIDLTAQGFAFDKSTVTVPAGASVTIRFVNKDNAPHNFAAYETSAVQKPIFVGQLITGPTATIEYKFTAPTTAGSYYFRCDAHPSMNGKFVVTSP